MKIRGVIQCLSTMAIVLLSLSTRADSVNTQELAQTVQWQPWSQDVFLQAKESNKLLLVDISAVWCAFCKKMDQTTYRDPEVLKIIAAHYLPVRVKEGDPDHPDVERFKGYARPTTVIFNAAGEQVIAKKGYLKPQWMNWMLQAVAQDPAVEEN